MGSYIMHICISNIIKKKHNLSEKYLYGCILPDLQKELGVDREKTHYTKRVEKEGSIRYLPQIEVAIKELKDKLAEEIYLGYISHLIEDYIWFDKYITLCTKKVNDGTVIYLKDNSLHSLEEYRKDVYADYKHFARYFIGKCDTEFNDVINSIINVANEEEITLLTKNTNLAVDIGEKPILLSKEIVDNYICECVSQVEKFIEEIMDLERKMQAAH